ncbi:hypothetical protein DPX16_23873 [Anabarilius grahami]|uniref:Uncharacterized protein n=1 Tax=Anabarilius grahami TaxID=495550 RepID=A0A3N0YXE2_ANAGA|nr:hypothetical protein DPX16_23873 [Anabarilius grahami]
MVSQPERLELPLMLMAITDIMQESTRVSPAELMTARQVTLPLHLYQPGDSSLITVLMTDMLREVSSSMESMAMGRIPPYPVQTVLDVATGRPTEPLQAHLAYSLGTSILLHVEPEQSEVVFLLNPPIIEADNIYRPKDRVNVRWWQGNTHLKIHTSDAAVYHDSNPQLLAGIGQLQPMISDTRCPAEAKPRTQVTRTQAEMVDDRWLINTPTRTATLTYNQHDTATHVSLPNQKYQSELETPSFFRNHNLTLDPELELRIEKGGSQLIHITPIDTALQALSRLPILTSSPIVQAWTATNMALYSSLAIEYTLILGLAFILSKGINGMRESMNKCLPALPRGFKRRQRRGGVKPDSYAQPHQDGQRTSWNHLLVDHPDPWAIRLCYRPMRSTQELRWPKGGL